MRTNTLLLCRVACAIVYRSHRFVRRGPVFCMDPNTAFYPGTERTTMNRLVPFRSVPKGRVGLRQALTSGIEHPVDDPKEGYLVLICHTPETSFRRPPLAELGVGARSFAGDTEGCCGGRLGRSRAATGGRVALGNSRSPKSVLHPTRLWGSKARR